VRDFIDDGDPYDDAPHICPGCHAVDEDPHDEDCPDAEIEQRRIDRADDSDDTVCTRCMVYPCECGDGEEVYDG
jgi:hypothetical protein